MNELMNPVSEPVMYKSALTLSYFEDSGWYAVDYSHADKLGWGSNEGCDFVQAKCVDGWSDFYFCRNLTAGGCTADMRFQAQCNLDSNPYITYPRWVERIVNGLLHHTCVRRRFRPSINPHYRLSAETRRHTSHPAFRRRASRVYVCSNYQYFPGQPGMGGKQPHTDYCPYYQLFSARDCQDSGEL